MVDLTRYRNIFGEPDKGVHSYRIFGLAAVDLGLTILAAYLASRAWDWNFLMTFLGLVLIGIGIHGLFGVDTALNKWLGVAKEYKK